MELIILTMLLALVAAEPLFPDTMPPAIIPRKAEEPESGIANGAKDVGPHVSPFGWAIVGVFSAGALLIVGLTLRHYYWHKWFPTKKNGDLESGQAFSSGSV